MTETEEFVRLRPLLFSIAYRMLGSVAEAEDAVQDAYLRWRQVAHEEIGSARSYLTTVVTRLCLDRLRSAQARRESYVGTWLPEPLLTEESPDVAAHAELADSVSMAFLVLLESLSPPERAAFLLREVFGFDYAEVADALGRSEQACRQLVSRARRAVGERRRRFAADRARGRALTERFLVAAAGGDMQALMDLLAEDVVVWSDGGGRITAARRPVAGRDRVARFLVRIAARMLPPEPTVRVTEVNGQPGAVLFSSGRPYAVFALDVREGLISGVRVVLNPDKLSRLRLAAPSGGVFGARFRGAAEESHGGGPAGPSR